MFNGFEFRGRQLKVHFDKYAQQANDAANGVMSGIPGDEDGILSTMPQPSSLASIAGLGRPSRAFTPPIGVSVASQRSIAADRPASRNFTAPQPVSTNSASVFPNTINGERRASFSTTSDSRSARQTPEPQTHPHDRPSSLYINTSAPYAGSARTETVSDTSRPASQNQSQPSHRQGPGPLHFSQQERYSTGPAALMSPPVPGMGTPGFHPFSPQTGRIAMTPSMPGFSFMPFPQTPPIIPSFLSPGIGPFSPPLGGGAFNSQMSSYMNPAPGAPIHFRKSSEQPRLQLPKS